MLEKAAAHLARSGGADAMIGDDEINENSFEAAGFRPAPGCAPPWPDMATSEEGDLD